MMIYPDLTNNGIQTFSVSAWQVPGSHVVKARNVEPMLPSDQRLYFALERSTKIGYDLMGCLHRHEWRVEYDMVRA